MSTTPHKDPLHGKTLQSIVEQLHAHYGWEGLNDRIAIRCFSVEPSVKSSLKFLRKTPWAREKVEALYIKSLKRKGFNAGTESSTFYEK